MTIEQIKSELGQLGLHERQDIAYWLLHQNAAPSQPGIVSTEDVCGGEARIAGTRIPVWVIAALRGQGLENPAIAKAYPTLRAGDVENALRYADSHREEIERAIAANEALCPMALLMADEDFPFPCVVELRALGHDVITSSEAGLKDQSTPDNAVLVAAIATGRAVGSDTVCPRCLILRRIRGGCFGIRQVAFSSGGSYRGGNGHHLFVMPQANPGSPGSCWQARPLPLL